MKRKFALRTVAVSLGTVLCMGCAVTFAGCGGIRADKEALVIMTEDLNELYNPFYSTAGTDMDVVGQTQLSMLSTDENGALSYGKDEPTVVLDYEEKILADTTEYYYVLKNGLKFSDGVPLTMNDVMFNLYVYLDPAYTGSTTMYSTDIVGLQAYRTQSDTNQDNQDEEVSNTANLYATQRMQELIDLYNLTAEMDNINGKHRATPAEMKAAISEHNCSESYLQSIGLLGEENAQAQARVQLQADYDNVIAKFQEELKNDFKSARSAYTEEPYKSAAIYYNGKEISKGFNDIISFMYAERLVEITYPRDPNTNQYDKSQIEKATLLYNPDSVQDEDSAIKYAYNSNVSSAFDQILQYWATGTQLFNEFVGKAKDVILHGNLEGDELKYKSVSGIVSLGHNTTLTEIDVGNTTYKVAHDHNDDGTPKNAGEYDVLRITINKVDPKAKWNFGFTVAPYHYYSDPNKYSINIAQEQFGVAWADFDFQTGVLQGDNSWGASKNKIPLGAGPYVASNKEGDTQRPQKDDFFNNDIVYYVANDNFSLNGVEADGGKYVPKIKKMRYMETPVSNALSSLESGQVHFVSPQFTNDNAKRIAELESEGIGSVDSWQLGYGYIGINAAKVPKLELRKAIMAAMNTELALQYYLTGSAVNIYWPMSCVSWAYPRESGYSYDGSNPTAHRDDANGKTYTHYTTKENAIKQIKQYMTEANASTSDLEVEFTIAGANMYDHPAYLVFKNAMDILNECGWAVTIKPDANALTKLATGSLQVWAAAWGSTIDPDMYQVYHKNSSATSVLAWGYNAIKDTAQSEYAEERDILNKLSDKIDDAREVTDEATRAAIYKEAMGYVLDLAIELPLYQRKTLYAYNLNVIKEESMPHDENGNLKINPYTSPLAKIWEIEFTD